MTEFISIRGARENNLKDVTLQIPRRKLTIFTGVSGSGKSSIVFDTLATEAQRQLYENFSLFIRNFLPKYPQPDADAIENLTMAVIVDQKRLGGGSHSTIGTVTDIHGVLRLLFSRVGKPSAGGAIAYSFNHPRGACPECGGLGKKVGVVSDDFLDMSKSLNGGAVQVSFFGEWEAQAYTLSGFFDNDKKLSNTLSGGESQRVRMVKHLGSSLVDVMCIFDEPSVGLHARDVHRLNELLGKLRDKGNTVIVVEHDPAVIEAADHIVDVGPGAGSGGGTIVFEGTYQELLKSDTLTGRHLKQALPIKKDVRKPTARLRIKNARANNLKNISVDIPKGVLTAVTGVAGSGKSSLINEVFFVQHPGAIVIDQSAVGASTRSLCQPRDGPEC
jgi:excinuclease UvrABC ATPase subunit